MKKVVVLTGAGISAESGISTFRDSNGLWENHRIEDVANYDSWERNPDLVRKFYNERRKQLHEVVPNQAHKDLVKLEEVFDVTIITQNVDDLHERAGSKNVIHLHGELNKACSVVDANEVHTINGWELKETDVDKYGKPLRPFIVFFGEAVPMIEPAIKECEQADIMLIIGTSLNVYPAAGLMQYCKKQCRKFLVDPKEPNASLAGIRFIKEKATIGVRQAVEEMLNIN